MKTKIGILVVTMALCAGNALAQKTGSQNVVVTNTATNPVPAVLQGTTNVAGTVGISGIVDVSLINIPSFTLSGIPTVNLAKGNFVGILNTTDQPVPVREVEVPARQAFQHRVDFVIQVPQGESSGGWQITVPNNKRLVIEYVSASGGFDAEGFPELWIFTTVNGMKVKHLIPVTKVSGSSFSAIWMAGSLTRLYADPETTVEAKFVFWGGFSLPAFSVRDLAISGYTVDCAEGRQGCPTP